MSASTYGCRNRPEYRAVVVVQDGWYLDGTTRVPRMAAVPFRQSPDCQYTHSELGRADAGCIGCKWRAP